MHATVSALFGYLCQQFYHFYLFYLFVYCLFLSLSHSSRVGVVFTHLSYLHSVLHPLVTPCQQFFSVFLILLIYLLSLSLTHSLRVGVVFAAVYHSLSIMATLFLRGRGGCECGCPRLMSVSKAGSVFVQRF